MRLSCGCPCHSVRGRPFPPLFSLLNPSFVHCSVKDGSQTPSIPPPLSNLQSLGLHHSQAARTCAQKRVGQTNTHARMCIIHYTCALADGEETRRSAATLVAFPVAVPHVMKVVGILLELFYVWLSAKVPGQQQHTSSILLLTLCLQPCSSLNSCALSYLVSVQSHAL